MKIAVGSDHGGYNLKTEIVNYLTKNGYEVIDVGTNNTESVDYPIYGEKVAKLVSTKECEYGVVICTSGEGIMISANKVAGVRCGIAYNDEVTRLMRLHNDANVIAFGQKFTSTSDALFRLDIFLNTQFEGGRHQRRVELIDKI